MAFLLPDTAALRDIADRIDHHAVVTRTRAGRLRTAVQAVHWHGVAASAFHAEVHVVLAMLAAAADRLAAAADALRRHADDVGEIRRELSRLWHDGVALEKAGLHAAGDVLDAGMDVVGDALDAVGL